MDANLALGIMVVGGYTQDYSLHSGSSGSNVPFLIAYSITNTTIFWA